MSSDPSRAQLRCCQGAGSTEEDCGWRRSCHHLDGRWAVGMSAALWGPSVGQGGPGFHHVSFGGGRPSIVCEVLLYVIL